MEHVRELNELNKCYAQNENCVVVLYGNSFDGLPDIVRDFTKDKETYVYHSVCCTVDVQQQMMQKELNSFINLLKVRSDTKYILVIEEFQFVCRENADLYTFMMNDLRDKLQNRNIFVLLTTSDVHFIENKFLSVLGKKAYEITATINVSAPDFSDLCQRYKNVPKEDLFSMYSFFNHRSDLWEYWDFGKSVKDNILYFLLAFDSPLRYAFSAILPADLREHAVYNTILMQMAFGNTKLNDLYKSTNLNRAKISVYLKKLMEYHIIMKCNSADIGNVNAVKKGYYYFIDPCMYLYYRYIFPNNGLLYSVSGDKFFKKCIEPDLDTIFEQSFRFICYERIVDQNEKGLLPVRCDEISFYADKSERIDFVGISETKTIVFSCYSRMPYMSYMRLEELYASLKSAGLNPDYIVLLSLKGFDQKLQMYAHVHDELLLIEGI